MLYLKQSAGIAADGQPRRVLIGEKSMLRLEQSLLTNDKDTRLRELAHAAAEDPQFSAWVLRAAENRTSRTINRIDEATEWLSDCLVVELASSLEIDDAAGRAAESEKRFFALVQKLGEYERKLGHFERRLQLEKLESLKELAYGASHEINNPLANIAARAQTLLEDEDDPERARKLIAIHRQALRAHEMISDLMLFARPPKLEKKLLDLHRLVQTIVNEHEEFAQEHEVQLTCEPYEAALKVMADETQLAVAVSALLKNSIEAVPSGGRVQIAARRAADVGSAPVAEISVCDNGPGIAEEIRLHIFDPFFSGREAGRGLGFGLSKCWRIVSEHGGQVMVRRSNAFGTEFCIQLPLDVNDS
jgi:signal transduction histidine kinase